MEYALIEKRKLTSSHSKENMEKVARRMKETHPLNEYVVVEETK